MLYGKKGGVRVMVTGQSSGIKMDEEEEKWK